MFVKGFDKFRAVVRPDALCLERERIYGHLGNWTEEYVDWSDGPDGGSDSETIYADAGNIEFMAAWTENLLEYPTTDWSNLTICDIASLDRNLAPSLMFGNA